LGAEEVGQFAKGVLVEGYSQGIDGKITAVEVQFQGTVLDHGERRGRFVVFKPAVAMSILKPSR